MPNTNQEITHDIQSASANIALNFTERFQKEYPGYAHAFVIMDDLCGQIKTLAQSERDKAWNECLDVVLKSIEETPTSAKTPIWSKKYFIEELQKLRK